MSSKIKIIIPLIFLSVLLALAVAVKKNQQPENVVIPDDCEVAVDPIEQPERFYLYGIEADSFEVVKSKIKRNQFVADILTGYGLKNSEVLDITGKYKEVFDVRRFKTGQSYTMFLEKDSVLQPAYFVYEINDIEYVVYDFVNDTVYRDNKPTYVERKEATGIIESSLYLTMKENDLNPLLAMELADIYAWVVDFYKLQKGDRFKVIYLENFVEGKPTGIDKILAAVFTHYDNDFYSFYFQPDSAIVGNYFDERAESLRKAFLKAPLKYSRISSYYTKRRFHPILKRYRPHLGVDYAAPTGTPIMSVGDGIVLEARYKSGNGNYVKIKHNSVYSTQYLHMTKFAKGIKPGAKVVQGQTIGYVGSTGLATGPHVCFRFWKNGVQVNPLKVDVPPAEPVEEQYVDQYYKTIKPLRVELDSMGWKEEGVAMR